MPYLAVVWLRDDDAVNEFLEEEGTGRITGIYRFPKRDVKLCKGFTNGCRWQAWKRHKLGHYVHACNLRNPDWWRTLAMGFIDSFGINLLPRDRTPKLFQNPEQWEQPIQLGTFGPLPEFSTKKRPHSEE